MSHTFNNIEEFKDSIIESLNREDYTQEIENIKVGINTILNDKLRWWWVEGETLYLVKNAGGDLFIIYRHPSEESKQYLWFCNVNNTTHYDTWNMFDHTRGDPLGGVSWVREYIVLDSHSWRFLNWDKNPLEGKQ